MRSYVKAAALAALLAAALAAPMAAAHLIFVYNEKVSFKAVTPVIFKAGPEASAVQLSLYNVTGGNTGTAGAFITLTIPVTNATYEYVYQPLELYVNNVFATGTPVLSVASCSYTGSATLSSVTLVIYPTSSSPGQGENITITPSTSSCSATGTATLAQGSTYYVDFKVIPALPVPYQSSGTLTLYLEVENVTSSS